MLIVGRQIGADILALKSKMAKFFDMIDIVEAGHILKICINHDRSKKRFPLS